MLRFLFIATFCLICADVQAANLRQLRERVEMNFATVIADPDGDVIRLNPNGTIVASNGSLFVGSPSAAQFTIKGRKNRAIFISFSSGDFLTGGGSKMALSNLRHDQGPSPSLGHNGKLTFKVGANLIIGARQASGVYSGTYLVTVDYP